MESNRSQIIRDPSDKIQLILWLVVCSTANKIATTNAENVLRIGNAYGEIFQLIFWHPMDDGQLEGVNIWYHWRETPFLEWHADEFSPCIRHILAKKGPNDTTGLNHGDQTVIQAECCHFTENYVKWQPLHNNKLYFSKSTMLTVIIHYTQFKIFKILKNMLQFVI